jgi:hypothetical protein
MNQKVGITANAMGAPLAKWGADESHFTGIEYALWRTHQVLTATRFN